MTELKWISPLEAARLVLRETCPEIADELDENHLWHPVRNGWSTNHKSDTEKVDRARSALSDVRKACLDGRLRARGIFNGEGLPTKIEPAEFNGAFSVFRATLDNTIDPRHRRVFHLITVEYKNALSLAREATRIQSAKPKMSLATLAERVSKADPEVIGKEEWVSIQVAEGASRNAARGAWDNEHGSPKRGRPSKKIAG